jgi:peptide/nickel transport system permease protein
MGLRRICLKAAPIRTVTRCALLGPGLLSTVIAITIVYTPIFARVTRSLVLSVKEMEYITAARGLGIQEWRILVRHVLPNTVAPLIAQVSLALS